LYPVKHGFARQKRVILIVSGTALVQEVNSSRLFIPAWGLYQDTTYLNSAKS
jgi:hypothetical protein